MARIKVLLTGIASALIFSAILFLSAGTVYFIQGWIFLFTNVLTSLIHFLAYPNDNELASERSAVIEGTKPWDKVILRISAAVYLLTIVVAGLDSGRFHWSPAYGLLFNAVGILLIVGGQIIFLSALRTNRFFSSVVRIQKERRHIVCDSGIYQIVRHPGYLGMIISLAGLPFITGSVWSAIPIVINIILLLIRTNLEDLTLKNELPGYQTYSLKTRHKLIPMVW